MRSGQSVYSQYQMLMDLKGDMDSNAILMGHFKSYIYQLTVQPDQNNQPS